MQEIAEYLQNLNLKRIGVPLRNISAKLINIVHAEMKPGQVISLQLMTVEVLSIVMIWRIDSFMIWRPAD